MSKNIDVIVVGSCVVDLNFYTKALPTVGQTVTGSFETGLGGKGFNQAVASARSGASTLFIGAVGDDSFGRQFEEFKQENLTIELIKLKREVTGAASINIDQSGNNNIVVSLGANKKLKLQHILKFKENFKKASVLLLQRENSDELINSVIRFARSVNKNIKIILNPAPYSPDCKISQQVDYLTPNETEFVGIHKTAPFWFEKDSSIIKETLDRLILNYKPSIKYDNLIITLGAFGSYVFDKVTWDGKILPPLKVKAIDTTGAGDAFNGAFAAGLVLFDTELKAIKLATIVSGLSVTKKGTSKSIPSHKEIVKRYKELKWE